MFKRWLLCAFLPLNANASNIACQVNASEWLELASPVSGVVDIVHAKRGEWVKKGQPLVSLESSLERANLAFATSRYNSEGLINAREERVNFELRQMARNKEVMDKNIISAQQADEIKTALAVAEMELLEAQEQKKMFKDELAIAQINLDQKTIRSPISGVIVENLVGLGEQVSDEPIIKVAQLNPLHVEANLPAEYYGQISIGSPLSVQLSNSNQHQHQLDVILVDPVIDPRSHTFTVRMRLDNAEKQIPAGTKCQLTLPELANIQNKTTAGSDEQKLLDELNQITSGEY